MRLERLNLGPPTTMSMMAISMTPILHPPRNPTLLSQWLTLREHSLFSFLSAQSFSPLRSAMRFIIEEIRAKRLAAI